MLGVRSRPTVGLLAALTLIVAACGNGDAELEEMPEDADVDGEDAAGTEAAEDESVGEDEQADLEHVQVMMFPGQSYRIPALIAEQEGFFAERGIEISIVDQPGGVTGTQGLAATESDVGYITPVTAAQGWQAGEDVTFFCGSIDVTEQSLFAPADTDLPAIQDGASAEEVFEALSGTTIGVQTPVGSGLQLFFEAAVEAEGVTDLELINTGVDLPVVVASLEGGDVDLAQTTPALTQLLQHTGDAKELIYLPDHAEHYELYGSAILGDGEWLENNPETAAAYCDAIEEALDFILDDANADAVDELVVEDIGVEPEVAAMVRERSFPEFSTEIPEDVLNDTFEFNIEIGVLDPEPAPTYDNMVVEVRE